MVGQFFSKRSDEFSPTGQQDLPLLLKFWTYTLESPDVVPSSSQDLTLVRFLTLC
jgi:hypothetical protein